MVKPEKEAVLFKRRGSGRMLRRYFSWFNLSRCVDKGVSALFTAVPEAESNEPRWLIVHLMSIFRGEKNLQSRHPLAWGTQISSSLPHPPSVEFSIWLSYIGEIQTTFAFVVPSPCLFLCTQDDFNQNNPVTGLALTHLAIFFAYGRHSKAADCFFNHLSRVTHVASFYTLVYFLLNWC